MIRKAIFTYWCDRREKTNGGFSREQDLGVTLALALELAKKQFDKVELITNTSGKELLIDKFQLPFTKVLVELDQFDNTLHPDFWAYTKIYAYSIQKEPFIHIDNDVLIWDTIPIATLEADMFFQNKEHIDTHTGYNHTLMIASQFPLVNKLVLTSKVAYAYNCGVVGANDLELIAEWHEIVKQYLFSQENQQIWTETTDKHSQNHLFEQYFISALIALKDKKALTLLQDDFMKSAVRDFKYTHLWGEAKREQATMQRVRRRLFNDYPEYKSRIVFATDHTAVFEEIYEKQLWGEGLGSGAGSDIHLNRPYIAFLQEFLTEQDIKTVVDFGCGDWQFSRSIDWKEVEYQGWDCVDSIIQANKAVYQKENITFTTINDTFTAKNLSADLIIIKDVFIHWPNKQILQFIEELRQSNIRYALITTQVDNHDLNIDIHVGEFRNVDLNKLPFDLNLQEIFKWPNDTKITYLFKNK